MKQFGWLLGLTLLGMSIYYAWFNQYNHATYDLILGIWNIELNK